MQNYNFVSYFTGSGGHILHSNITKLRPKNQRRVAQMIRRAVSMGLQPSTHRHPEILKKEFADKDNFTSMRAVYMKSSG